MKRMIFKTTLSRLVLSWLAFGLVFWAPRAKAEVENNRLVAVLSFSGYAEFKRDLEYLGKLSGEPDTASSVERWLLLVTQGQALSAVDPSRPWGAFLSVTEASQFHGASFIPVGNFSKLVDAFSVIFGEPVDSSDNIYEFKSSNRSYYVMQKGNWAYWTQQKDALESLPSDPLAQLSGLDQQYDLAVSVNVQNIPKALRDTAAAFVARWSEITLRQKDGEGDQAPNVLNASDARSRIERLINSIHELDRVAMGLKIDRSNDCTDLDLEITALTGSAAAKAFASAFEKPKASRLSGTLLPGAILSLHVNSPLSDADEKQAKALLTRLGGQVLARIDDKLDGDEQRAKAKESVDRLVKVLNETIDNEARINFGLAVTAAESGDEFDDIINNAIEDAFPNRVHETIVGAGQVAVVAGCSTADSAASEDAAMQIAEMFADDSRESQPRLSVDKYRGWRLHAFSVMAPQTMRAEPPLRTLRNLLGNPVKIVLAFGDDAIFAAAGEKGIDVIKRMIDESTKSPAERLPPLRASMALAPLWKLIATEKRSKRASELAERLKAGGQDRVTFIVEQVPNGVRYRLQGQSGFNMLLGRSLGAVARATTDAAR